jgi:dipeptidyl aminopeptidase/acylaminoacyl peptidase
LRLIDITSGHVQRIDTGSVDITYTEWRSERHLLLAGHSGFDTVVGVYDLAAGSFTETWRSREVTTGGFSISLSGMNHPGDCVLVGESFIRAPEIGVVRHGDYRAVKSLDVSGALQTKIIDTVECVTWSAPDGLRIQGWLVRPRGEGPHPLVMNIHGGPVWHWRPHWLGRARTVPLLMLVKHGYAVFFPNPRGSVGRGQDFARRVLGDMGGLDTHDYLSGLDHLVCRGVAEPERIGVMGVSYGGYMSAWLTTQSSRFAAAVAVAPVGNRVSQHLTSNIPHFVRRFLADRYDNPGGRYFSRSPIMHARNARTPTLNVCGALDRCTPPSEAMQFHNALLENGAESVLATYPEEGHGVRAFPAAIDYAARVVGWFEKHMPPTDDDRR